MRIATYKTKPVIRASRWLVGLLTAALVLIPAPALAATKTYAITCVGSNVILNNGRLTCSASPAVAKVEGVGGAKQPLPSNGGVATVTVDCGSSSPVNPTVGSRAVFRCHNGSAPKINHLTNVQFYNAGSVTPAPPAPPPAGPTSTCNADKCDLIAQYVNPLVNVLSAIFGLLAIVSIILGGIQFSTSEGDPQKASNAKNRIAGTVVAIFAYALLYGFLQFIIPGGLLQKP